MPETSEKLAVIGAGPVGLGMAHALKAHGIPYDQFEADEDIGGNWHHGVYSTTHTISSRKVTQFPDYPMPKNYPDYPSRVQVLAYLRDYAKHAGLYENIAFNSKVLMARPRADWRWDVTLASGEARTYKGLVVCNGHDWSRRFPKYPGTFTGEYLHSKDYKQPSQLNGRRVLVIGSGNSAVDVATEAARVGASSDISLRRGQWFVPKVIFGKPFHEAFPLWTPLWVSRLLLTLALKIAVGDYRRYGLPKPPDKLFVRVPTFNFELLHYLRHGRITPRPAVTRFEGDKVLFEDGSSASYDMVVCATGFNLDFPFFPKGLVPVKEDVAPLYGQVLLPEYKHLYIATALHPIYGFGPLIAEGGKLLACLIQLQDRIQLPIARVLKACGNKPVKTHLLHPGPALRDMRRAQRILPILVPFVDRRLSRKASRTAPVTDERAPGERLNADMTVY